MDGMVSRLLSGDGLREDETFFLFFGLEIPKVETDTKRVGAMPVSLISFSFFLFSSSPIFLSYAHAWNRGQSSLARPHTARPVAKLTHTCAHDGARGGAHQHSSVR